MAQMVVGLMHAENGSYGISFPDYPRIVSAAKTSNEAFARGRDTLAFHVRETIEDGDDLPLLSNVMFSQIKNVVCRLCHRVLGLVLHSRLICRRVEQKCALILHLPKCTSR